MPLVSAGSVSKQSRQRRQAGFVGAHQIPGGLRAGDRPDHDADLHAGCCLCGPGRADAVAGVDEEIDVDNTCLRTACGWCRRVPLGACRRRPDRQAIAAEHRPEWIEHLPGREQHAYVHAAEFGETEIFAGEARMRRICG